MRKLTSIVGLIVALGLLAQDKTALKYAKTINIEDLNTHLSILSSDEYEGRETGKKGQKMAAAYISKQFESLGLEAPVDGSYYQRFDLLESQIGNVYFRKGENKKVGFEDFIYYSQAETTGEEYIKLVMANENSDTKLFDGAYVAFATQALGGYQDFVDKATMAGAKGFFIILENDEEFESTVNRFGSYLRRPRLQLDGRNEQSDKVIIGSKDLATWLFDKPYDEIIEGDKSIVIFNADYLDRPVETENVMGFLKGSEKPDELLIISAHYDHIGFTADGEVNNGADDDGSGVSAVLEMAEAFVAATKKGKGPKRSILFLMVTGEEKGLLGSRYYTDFDPIFPLENTVANLNIDMIGRVDPAHENNSDYIYLIGSDKLSTELHELSERMNKTYTNLELDYAFNDDNDPNRFYYRSDHYNFAKNNIPIIFYFNGTHPDYHKPTDTIEKIEFETLKKRANLIFHTGWEIANQEKRLLVDVMELKNDK